MYSLISETYNYIHSGAGTVTLAGIIWAIAAGFAVGMFLSYYNKNYLGETVRRLYKKGADSKETALTLKELGLAPTKLRTRSLREGGSLRKYVRIANEEEAVTSLGRKKRPKIVEFLFPSSEKFSCDFETAKFYMPEEEKYKAAVRYDQRSRLSPVLLVSVLIVLAAVALGITFAAPKILKLLDNFITSIVQK